MEEAGTEADPHATMSITRRRFLQASAAGGVAVAGAAAYYAADDPDPTKPSDATVRLSINGEQHEVAVDNRTSLLDLLRERVKLTGTKKGCDQGACGACTILLDGARVNSCLTLAVMHDGAQITTVEGLAQRSPATGQDELHPLQQAFIDEDAFQCGYCTAGQLMSAVACIKEGHTGSRAEIREWMSGNICRCGAYTNIVTAIERCSPKTSAKGI